MGKVAKSDPEVTESLGTYYILKSTTRVGWRAMHQTSKAGQVAQKTVPAEQWPALGLNHFMTIEQAREQIKFFNLKQAPVREKLRSQIKRAHRDRDVESELLPRHLVVQFTDDLTANLSASPAHIDKVLCQWKIVQEIVKELALEPREYHLKAKAVYSFFIKHEYSLDYSRKLLNLLNNWGQWYSFKQNLAFLPLRTPRGSDREKIVDVNSVKTGRRRKAKPMTEEMLSKFKSNLTEAEYHWVYLSFYFGLRPTEVDCLLRPDDDFTFKIESILANGVRIPVLGIYQTKLTARPRDSRWKYIPLIISEQLAGLAIIEAGGFGRPGSGLMASIIKGSGLYSGRKGFKNLMESKGQILANISKWMGHSTIITTETKYDDLTSVHFDEVRSANTGRIKP